MEHGLTLIDVGKVTLRGSLILREDAQGLVLFAHGSGSSRLSPRNQEVAAILRETGIGTLLFDLLTREEDARDDLTGELRFDIPFLAGRLHEVTTWVRQYVPRSDLRIGYFGASTGAAAALTAAAEAGNEISAIVSRGGRPDLAREALPRVEAPTLLIVGARDRAVIEFNQSALERLQCLKQLTVIPGTGHLFEEPGTLDQVARLAAGWFQRHLTERPPSLQPTFHRKRDTPTR
jgi:putative phosphoribosyl transferase